MFRPVVYEHGMSSGRYKLDAEHGARWSPLAALHIAYPLSAGGSTDIAVVHFRALCSLSALALFPLYVPLVRGRVERNNRRARARARGFTFLTAKNHKLTHGLLMLYLDDKSQNLIQPPAQRAPSLPSFSAF